MSEVTVTMSVEAARALLLANRVFTAIPRTNALGVRLCGDHEPPTFQGFREGCAALALAVELHEMGVKSR